VPCPRLLACCLAALTLAPAAASGGESDAQKLHRKGVHCMEEIERAECAIEHFEALLDEQTEDRELITDALLRLIKLYEKAGDDEAVKGGDAALLGRGPRQAAARAPAVHARFLPKDFDVLALAHLPRLMTAPLTKRLEPELAESVTTCDDGRRKELEEHFNWRKAQVRAREQNISLQKALDQQATASRSERAARAKRRAERDPQAKTRPAPVFGDGLCQTIRALGGVDAKDWTRMLVAFFHGDMRRSVIVAEVPGLNDRIAAGVAAGTLAPAGTNTWTLVGVSYQKAPVLLASYELDELVVAPQGLLPEIAANHAKGKRTLAKSVDKLVAGIPVDAGFFAVLTETAVREMGFGGMSKGRRRFLEALLPHPEGVQVAGVVHEYFGAFIRVPTDTPVKAAALVNIARRVMESQAEADPEDAEFLRLLDLAQATDKRALLLSYVLSRGQIEQMVLK
jgi:hypothetical protein